MPLCTIHLLSLHTSTPNPLQIFLSALKSSDVTPLVVSRVIRWIILPSSISTGPLLAQNIHWDLLLILPTTDPLPRYLENLVQHHWSITAGVPSKLIQDFGSKNEKLLRPDSRSVPKLSGALDKPRIATSAQGLELSPELQSWIRAFSSSSAPEGSGAVSMLNLLAFNPEMKDSYLQYGKAFAESIGSKRGGNAKIVGTVVEKEGENAQWDEVALAHYPSILHFADMLASQDYQEVNKKHRVPALRDTLILCTSEVGIRESMGDADSEKKSRL